MRCLSLALLALSHSPLKELLAPNPDPAPRSYAPLQPSEVCLSTLAGCPAPDCLALSSDQLLLAATAGSTIQLYSTPDLAGPSISGGAVPVQPLASRTTPGGAGIRCFAWCGAPGHEGEYLVVTDAHQLLLGSVGSAAHTELAGNVLTAAWAPSEHLLAYATHGSRLVFAQPGGGVLVDVAVTHDRCKLKKAPRAGVWGVMGKWGRRSRVGAQEARVVCLSSDGLRGVLGGLPGRRALCLHC